LRLFRFGGQDFCFPTLPFGKDGAPFFVLTDAELRALLAQWLRTNPSTLLRAGWRRVRAGPSTSLRSAQDDIVLMEFVLSHPSAKCAEGWGTLFSCCWMPNCGPCLRKASHEPFDFAQGVPEACSCGSFDFATLRMTAGGIPPSFVLTDAKRRSFLSS
jgi:hypothetical protein